MHIKSFHLYNLTLTCVTGGIGVVIVTLPGTGVVKLPGLSVTFCAFANVVIVIQTTKHTAKNLLDGAIGLFIEIRFTVFDFAVASLYVTTINPIYTDL